MVRRLAFYAGLLSAACLAAADAVVDLGYAKYRGNISYPDTVAFLGLPYAEPPVGDLRWRAPVQLNTARVSREARGRVVNATAFPDFCIQGSTGCESYCLKWLIYVADRPQLVTLEVQEARIA